MCTPVGKPPFEVRGSLGQRHRTEALGSSKCARFREEQDVLVPIRSRPRHAMPRIRPRIVPVPARVNRSLPAGAPPASLSSTPSNLSPLTPREYRSLTGRGRGSFDLGREC